MIDIASLRNFEAQATRYGWRVDGLTRIVRKYDDNDDGDELGKMWCDNDARLIVAMRNSLTELLDEVERHRATIARVQGRLCGLRHSCPDWETAKSIQSVIDITTGAE